MSDLQQFTANNYLVPASGRVHGVKYSNDFGSVSSTDSIDWGSYKINSFPFIPQGAFIDNTQGLADLNIFIEEINYNILVPQGISKQSQFPALERATMTITGAGKVSIFFVDFPVLPDSGLVNIGNTVSVNLSSYSFAGALPVLPSVNNQGVPYQITLMRAQAESHQATITGAALVATLTPLAANYLKQLRLNFTDDVTIAAAGLESIVIKSGALIIYSGAVYLSAVAGQANRQELKLDLTDFKLGAAGDVITITIGTALATGSLFINAYFDGV